VTTSLTVYNVGTIDSLPLMKITGCGEAQLLVNDFLVCTLDIDEYVVLDSRMQNAYKGNQLKNRQMTGNFPVLKPGKNVISYIGDVTEIETLARSRFL
jgi:phage-related protein